MRKKKISKPSIIVSEKKIETPTVITFEVETVCGFLIFQLVKSVSEQLLCIKPCTTTPCRAVAPYPKFMVQLTINEFF